MNRARPIVLGENNRISARPVTAIEIELHKRVAAENAAQEHRRLVGANAGGRHGGLPSLPPGNEIGHEVVSARHSPKPQKTPKGRERRKVAKARRPVEPTAEPTQVEPEAKTEIAPAPARVRHVRKPVRRGKPKPLIADVFTHYEAEVHAEDFERHVSSFDDLGLLPAPAVESETIAEARVAAPEIRVEPEIRVDARIAEPEILFDFEIAEATVAAPEILVPEVVEAVVVEPEVVAAPVVEAPVVDLVEAPVVEPEVLHVDPVVEPEVLHVDPVVEPAIVVEPEVVEAKVAEPQVVFAPEVVEPVVIEPVVVEPEVVEARVAEPQVVFAPEVVEPVVVEPLVVEPEVVEARVAEPEILVEPEFVVDLSGALPEPILDFAEIDKPRRRTRFRLWRRTPRTHRIEQLRQALREAETLEPAVREVVVPEVREVIVPEVREAVEPEVREVIVPEVREAVEPVVREVVVPEVLLEREAAASSPASDPVPEMIDLSGGLARKSRADLAQYREQEPLRPNLFAASARTPRVKKIRAKGRRGWVVDYVVPDSESEDTGA